MHQQLLRFFRVVRASGDLDGPYAEHWIRVARRSPSQLDGSGVTGGERDRITKPAAGGRARPAGFEKMRRARCAGEEGVDLRFQARIAAGDARHPADELDRFDERPPVARVEALAHGLSCRVGNVRDPIAGPDQQIRQLLPGFDAAQDLDGVLAYVAARMKRGQSCLGPMRSVGEISLELLPAGEQIGIPPPISRALIEPEKIEGSDVLQTVAHRPERSPLRTGEQP